MSRIGTCPACGRIASLNPDGESFATHSIDGRVCSGDPASTASGDHSPEPGSDSTPTTRAALDPLGATANWGSRHNWLTTTIPILAAAVLVGALAIGIPSAVHKRHEAQQLAVQEAQWYKRVDSFCQTYKAPAVPHADALTAIRAFDDSSAPPYTTAMDSVEERCPAVWEKVARAIDEEELVDDSEDPDSEVAAPRLSDTWEPDDLQKRLFVSTLHQLDPAFRAEDDGDLIGLGVQVCESLANGNSRETVIDLLVGLSGWPGMQAARFVVADQQDLCP